MIGNFLELAVGKNQLLVVRERSDRPGRVRQDSRPGEGRTDRDQLTKGESNAKKPFRRHKAVQG